MEFNDTTEGTVVIIELSGKIMGGPDAARFQQRIREFADGGVQELILDLEKVTWINSLGLGMLITAMTTIRNRGGRLALANTKTIDELLRLTNLSTVFLIYNSRDAAVRALGRD